MKAPQHSPSELLVGYVFLSRKELSLFRRLINGRRPLPVHQATGWACHECSFASPDLRAVVRHIVRTHGAASKDEDGLEEDDATLADRGWFDEKVDVQSRPGIPMHGKGVAPMMTNRTL
jgi:hypothetical protein